MRAVVWIALAIAALAPAASAQKAPAARTRKVFVSVTDRDGLPIVDLQPGDFDVREGGAKRTILRAAPATSPMRVAVLVDTGEAVAPSLNQVRAGLAEFFDALPAKHEALLVSTGRQLRVRVQPTFERKKLKDAAAGLFSDGGGSALIDSILEVDDRFMKRAEDRWPVFVVLTTDGAENSAGAHELAFNKWLDSVGPRGVTGHSLIIKTRGNGLTEIIANSVAENTGGQYIVVNTPNSVPEKMRALATRLGDDYQIARTRYEVEFATDAAGSPPVDVGVQRDGVSLRITQTRLR
jgi:hypothetical protein